MKPRWIVALVIVLLALFAIRPRPHPVADDPAATTPAASAPIPPAATPPREATAPPAPGATSSAPASAPPQNVPANFPPTTPGTPPSPALAGAPPVPGEPPAPEAPASFAEVRDEIDAIQFGLRDYRTANGENPIGSNAEITKALTGDNPKQVRIAIPAGSKVNGDGEMCDRWGTPYFFHQLSGKQMEIHSAGPDRKMGTGDDLVVK